MKMRLTGIIVLVLSLIMKSSVVKCSDCKFSENAQDLIKINVGEIDWVDVEVNAAGLFEEFSKSCKIKDELKLKAREANNDIEVDLGTGRCRGKVCTWHLSIKPCLDNIFTLEHGSQTVEKTLEAKSATAMVSSGHSKLDKVSDEIVIDR